LPKSSWIKFTKVKVCPGNLESSSNGFSMFLVSYSNCQIETFCCVTIFVLFKPWFIITQQQLFSYKLQLINQYFQNSPTKSFKFFPKIFDNVWQTTTKTSTVYQNRFHRSKFLNVSGWKHKKLVGVFTQITLCRQLWHILNVILNYVSVLDRFRQNFTFPPKRNWKAFKIHFLLNIKFNLDGWLKESF
jgi:hypothetical protein